MARTLLVLGSVTLLSLSSCVSTRTYDMTVEKLKADLAAEQKKADAASAAAAATLDEKAKAEVELQKAKTAAGKLEADVAKSAQELDELRKKYAGVDAALVNELKDVPGVAIDKQGSIQVTGLSFEFAGGELKPDSQKALGQVAEALAKRTGLVYVDGHTDSVPVGNPETKKLYVDNLGLSVARAASVARALIAAKVAPERIIVRGFGETRPIESNDTAEGRAKNRRVEIRLVPAVGESK